MSADPALAFYDSNALLYLISTEFEKADIIQAKAVDRGVISVQVLNEITNIARKKHRLTISEIRIVLDDLRQGFEVTPLTVDTHEAGLHLIERHNFSTYDAMIVAAALEARCDVLYSEDMQHGLVVDGRLTIVNPFLDP